jgi:hypothetical protein
MNLAGWKDFKNRPVKPRSIIKWVIAVCCSVGGLTLILSSSHPLASMATRPINLSEEVSDLSGKALTLPQGFVQGRKPLQVAEVELITITPDGFFPSAITRSSGQFIIAYDNRSGSDDLNIRLASQSNSLVHQLVVPLSKNPWLGEFNLPAGKYLISEATHPGWSCVLTIN